MEMAILFFLFIVEIQCQKSFPYVSFMGQALANHGYVNLSEVGNDPSGSDNVQCRTDLITCCSHAQGNHRGDWYFPNGDRLPFPAPGVALSGDREAQRVDIRRTSGTVPCGIYRCDIETSAVYNSGMRETVYLGLYTSDRGKLNVQICVRA